MDDIQIVFLYVFGLLDDGFPEKPKHVARIK
jgi:hypothetical protein